MRNFYLSNTGSAFLAGSTGVFGSRYTPDGHAYFLGNTNNELRCFANSFINKDFSFIVTHPMHDMVNSENCMSLKIANRSTGSTMNQ